MRKTNPQTAKIKWTDGVPSKDSLQQGIIAAVKIRTGRTYARFSYLHQLTYEDLMLLAQALGYRPTGRAAEIIRQRDLAAEQSAKAQTELAGVT